MRSTLFAVGSIVEVYAAEHRQASNEDARRVAEPLAYVRAYAWQLSMQSRRAVRLSCNDPNQAMRILREFELPGPDALMRREGDAIVIRPAPRQSLLGVLRGLQPLTEDFPEIADREPETSAL